MLTIDFNSTPWGMTYTALTQRPIQLTPLQEEELEHSVAYDFRQVKDEDEEIAEDGDYTPTGHRPLQSRSTINFQAKQQR